MKILAYNKSFKIAGLPALLGRAKVARRLTLRYMPNEILEFKCHFEKILNGMN